MTHKEVVALLKERINRAHELWHDHSAFDTTGGDVTMSGNKAKDILAYVLAQQEELVLLRKIFADMVGHNDILHEAKQQERRRLKEIVGTVIVDWVSTATLIWADWVLREMDDD